MSPKWFHLYTAVGVVLAALFFHSLPASADGDIETTFTGPVMAGRPATFVITVTGCCPPPPCGWYRQWTRGKTFWGDGPSHTTVWNDYDSGKPQRGGSETPSAVQRAEVEYTYQHPGRYRLITSFTWGFQAMPGCASTGDSYYDTLVVDVLPDPDAIVDGWLGTFLDPQATQCGEASLPAVPIYVVAGLSGLSASGISGAEFRLRSWNNGFTSSEQVMPGWIKIGNAFQDGVTMAANCAVTAGVNRVPLLMVWLFPQTEDAYTNLYIEKHLKPSNSTYDDAMLILCDAPYFTAIRAGRGFSVLLGSTLQTVPCPPELVVSVEGRTWGQVKGLYR